MTYDDSCSAPAPRPVGIRANTRGPSLQLLYLSYIRSVAYLLLSGPGRGVRAWLSLWLRAWWRLPGWGTGGAPRPFGDDGAPLLSSHASPLPAAEGEAPASHSGNSGLQRTHRCGVLVFWGWDACTPQSCRILSDKAHTQRKIARWEREGCFHCHWENVRCPEQPMQIFG